MPVRPHVLLYCLLVSSPTMARTPIEVGNTRQTVTMDYLMESCTVVGETAGGLLNYFDCESYLYGILDAQAELNPGLPTGERACVPPSMPPWQIYEQLSGLETDAAWSGPAAPIVLRELRHRFPCH